MHYLEVVRVTLKNSPRTLFEFLNEPIYCKLTFNDNAYSEARIDSLN